MPKLLPLPILDFNTIRFLSIVPQFGLVLDIIWLIYVHTNTLNHKN